MVWAGYRFREELEGLKLEITCISFEIKIPLKKTK